MPLLLTGSPHVPLDVAEVVALPQARDLLYGILALPRPVDAGPVVQTIWTLYCLPGVQMHMRAARANIARLQDVIVHTTPPGVHTLLKPVDQASDMAPD